MTYCHAASDNGLQILISWLLIQDGSVLFLLEIAYDVLLNKFLLAWMSGNGIEQNKLHGLLPYSILSSHKLRIILKPLGEFPDSQLVTLDIHQVL